MAKISDIITARGENYTVPDSIYAIRDTTGGVTDERYTNNVIDALGGQENMPWWLADEVKRTSKPALPTLDLVLPLLGLKDDGEDVKNRKTAVEKFVDGAWKKDGEAKEKVEAALGERGWKFIKETLWPSAVHDKMLEDIKKERIKAMDEAPLDFGLFQLPNIPGSAFLTKMLLPRSTERLANTGEVKPQDVALDLVENGTMAVPGTAYVKYGGKALSKIPYSKIIGESLGSGVNALKNSKSAVITALGQGLGAVPNIAGNTVAPLTSEILDDIVYDPGEGMNDRANFSAGDVAVGGAVNQAVNRGLVRAIAPYMDRYSGALKAQGAKKLRDFFSRLGRSQSELGSDFVTANRNTLTSPVVRTFEDGTKVTPGELQALKDGYNIIPEGVGIEDYLNADLIDRVVNLVDNGEISMKTGAAIANEVKKSNERAAKNIAKLANESAMEANVAANEGRMFDAAGFQAEKDALENLTKRQLGGLRPQQILDGIQFVGDAPASRAMTPQGVATVINENPELYNYAYWKTGANKLDKLQNAVHQAWPSLIINKAGKSDYAPEVTKVMKEPIEQNREESRKQAKQVSVSRVLEAGKKDKSLTADDQKWLAEVANNPDVLRDGFADLKKNDDFKLWLLTGGNDLLSGTEAHRPIWEIK